MNPSSWRIFESSSLTLDAGASQRSLPTSTALRIRVRRSAIGSVIVITHPLPARLGHAREVSLQGELAEAQPAKLELAHVRARAAAELATVAVPHAELRRPQRFGNKTGTSHSALLTFRKREAEFLQEEPGLVVGPGRGNHGHVHSLGGLDLGVIDLRKDRMVADSHREVATSVEALRRQAAEVADTRQRDVDQAVQELVHAVPPQRHRAADLHPRPELE